MLDSTGGHMASRCVAAALVANALATVARQPLRFAEPHLGMSVRPASCLASELLAVRHVPRSRGLAPT